MYHSFHRDTMSVYQLQNVMDDFICALQKKLLLQGAARMGRMRQWQLANARPACRPGMLLACKLPFPLMPLPRDCRPHLRVRALRLLPLQRVWLCEEQDHPPQGAAAAWATLFSIDQPSWAGTAP